MTSSNAVARRSVSHLSPPTLLARLTGRHFSTETRARISASKAGPAIGLSKGYLRVRVSLFPRKWRYLHHLIYEQFHGPIPRGKVVCFLDGDKLNILPDNLEAMTNRELRLRSAS